MKKITRAFADKRYIGLTAVVASAPLALLLGSLTAGCGGGGGSSLASSEESGSAAANNGLLLTGSMVYSSNYATGGILSQVYVVSADGVTSTRLTSNGASELASGWSPSGSTILFSSNRENGNGFNNRDLYTMNADGTSVQRLTSDTSKNSVDAVWSPDGARIAYAAGGAIAIVNADGTDRVLITGSNVAHALSPSWSPDGARIAFVADTPGTTPATTTGATDDTSDSRTIFIVNADGSNQTLLTTGGEYIRRLAWSPDGQRIAFDSTLDTGGGVSGLRQLYRINSDGSERARLTSDANNDLSPSWSPDGSRILFSSNRDFGGAGGANAFDLYVINPDGTNIGRVTSTGRSPMVAPGGWKF